VREPLRRGRAGAQIGDVGPRIRGVGMIGTERCFADGECAAAMLLRSVYAALIS
jgi:hypothetical protein